MSDATQRWDGRFFRSLTAIALAGSVAVIALELLRLLFRNNQLFCPSHEPIATWNPADYGLDPSMVDDIAFESDDGSLLHAWYCRAASPIASVLYCHGNSGNLTWSAGSIPALNAAGLSVFLFDYRGFGRSTGYATLAGVLQDAEAAAREHHAMRPHDVPSILYGYSLGGAIAAQIAQRVYFDGLVMQSTFTTLADMARVRFPTLPIHLISGHDFDTIEVVRRLEIPMLVIHGTRDEVVPVWMGRELFRSCESARQLHIVEDAMHTDLYDRDAAGIVDAIRTFALSLADSEGPQPIAVIDPPTATDRLFAAIRRTAWMRRYTSLRPPMVPRREPAGS